MITRKADGPQSPIKPVNPECRRSVAVSSHKENKASSKLKTSAPHRKRRWERSDLPQAEASFALPAALEVRRTSGRKQVRDSGVIGGTSGLFRRCLSRFAPPNEEADSSQKGQRAGSRATINLRRRTSNPRQSTAGHSNHHQRHSNRLHHYVGLFPVCVVVAFLDLESNQGTKCIGMAQAQG